MHSPPFQHARASTSRFAAHSTLQRLSNAIVLSHGWRRGLIAFATGAASVLAMAPFSFSPVLFITLPVLVWLIDGIGSSGLPRLLAAARIGWCFGFGYFLAGLYWVGIAFLVDAKTFGWLMPIAVIGLPAGMAVWTALGAALASLLWSAGTLRIFALAVGLTIAEWVRGHALTGFPWNTFGYALAWPISTAQIASVIGLWGMTFLTVSIFATPAALIDRSIDNRYTRIPFIMGISLLVAVTAIGGIRLAMTPTQFVDGVRLRIMQPNLSQDAKFNYRAKNDVMARYIALSQRSTGPDSRGLRDVTHLIWPESAFPFLLQREPDALAQIAALLPASTILITGAARAEPVPNSTRLEARNSIHVIRNDGSFLATYDKVHLVPFGEYLPFQTQLERIGLMQLTKVPGGFGAGPSVQPLAIPGAPPALPFICYEIIFPEAARQEDQAPQWLLNLTNDGWFGRSTGPYQHFEQARLRAIEVGMPLVRAANTGISAVMDAAGRTVRSLPLGAEGVLDSPLPARLSATFYARFGDLFAALAVLLATILCIRNRTQKTKLRAANI